MGVNLSQHNQHGDRGERKAVAAHVSVHVFGVCTGVFNFVYLLLAILGGRSREATIQVDTHAGGPLVVNTKPAVPNLFCFKD